MSDFIREVDEEYRHDQFRTFLNRYWGVILAVVVLALTAAGGWRGYVHWRQTQAEAAGARYFDALELARSTPAAAISAFQALGGDAPSGYRLLARLRAASELGRNDANAGIKAFDGIAEDGSVDDEVRDVARLRAAMLAVDAADPAEVRRRLEPLADGNAAFRNPARELLAVAALKTDDDAGAKRWLDAIMADFSAPSDIRQRAALYLGLLRAGKPASPP